MNELQALHAELERLRTLVLLVYPYAEAVPVGVRDLLEEEVNGGPGWRDRVGPAYAQSNAN